MKKPLSIFVLIMMFMLLFPKALIAEEEDSIIYTEGNTQYVINGDEDSGYYITIVYYYGKEIEYTVPWTIGIYEVREIADGAFSNSDVAVLRLPESVTNINPSAYRDGTVIIVYDAFDNEVSITNNSLDNHEEKNKEKNEIIYEENGVSFEEYTVEMKDDDFMDTSKEEQEDNSFLDNLRDKLKNSFLFNGKLFSSNFSKNPLGFVIIGLSFIFLIFIYIKFIHRK